MNEDKIAIIVKVLHHYRTINNYIKANSLSCRVFYDSNHEVCIEKAKGFIESGVEALISVGSLYTSLSETFSVPVTPIYRDSFSFVNTIANALNTWDKVAIVTNDSLNDSFSTAAEEAQTLFPETVKIYYYSWPNGMSEAINRVKSDSYKCAIAPSWAADQLRIAGIQPLFASLSERNIHDAIEQAKIGQINYRKINESKALINTILDNNDLGYIVIDDSGIINYASASALKILNIDSGRIVSKKYTDTPICKTGVQECLKYGISSNGIIISIDDQNIMCNCSKININETNSMVMVTLNPVENIYNNEKTLKERMIARGSNAIKTFSSIIGKSKAISETIETAKRYSHYDSVTLITAPSGCGKEIFAQSIHNESSRSSSPFMVINCAALPASILESVLFGYESGTFTGAKHSGKAGLFELANGGTVFMDEVSEMPIDMQSRFLRVLQEKEVMRIGSERAISVNVRVIAATNKSLPKLVSEGKFREDLYYRLSVLVLNIPPLNQRTEDIELLSNYYLVTRGKELNLHIDSLSDEALSILKRIDYPGNIRQLNNILERAMVLSDSSIISADTIVRAIGSDSISVNYPADALSGESKPQIIVQNHVDNTSAPDSFGSSADKSDNLLSIMEDTEKKLLEKLLSECSSRTEAAMKLNISTTTLWRKMKKYNL